MLEVRHKPSEVVRTTGTLDELRQVVLEWRKSCNGEEFGIDINLETHFRDLAGLVENEDSDLFLLKENGEIVGYIGMRVFRSPLGDQKICQEHYWFTLEKSNGALRLLRAIEKWAKEKGCSHLIMTTSCLASNMHDRLCEFYERIGFRKFETSFIKSI